MAGHEPSTDHANAPSAAAEAIWDWRRQATGAASGGATAAKRLRRRALVEAVVAAAAGGFLFAWKPPLAWVAWTIGAATLLAGLLSPQTFYAGLRRAFARFGHAVGQVLTAVLLVPLYFGFFSLFGAFFRRGRRNRMEPRFDRAAASYWKRRDDRERTLADYERLS
jgi:hypothetical protein